MIALNSVEIKPTIFPDKTSQVWKIPNLEGVVFHINWDFENEAELFYIMQLVQLIRKHNSTIDPVIGLRMMFFPYARQDKEITNDSTFALHTFCDILKTLELSYIETQDIHNFSAVADYALNVKNYTSENEIRDTIACCNTDTLLFPDYGAWDRYKKYSLGSKVSKVIADKVRDQQTGRIERLTLMGINETDSFGNVLIVDDLCDGGGTFIMAVNELKKYNVKNIDLFTTHGIYSKGTSVLFDAGISRIFNRKGEVLTRT
jgi:ribose-phosphate pyrophosphokinase